LQSKPAGTSHPNPGNDKVTTSARRSRPINARHTRHVSGTPCTNTTGISNPRSYAVGEGDGSVGRKRSARTASATDSPEKRNSTWVPEGTNTSGLKRCRVVSWGLGRGVDETRSLRVSAGASAGDGAQPQRA